MHVREALWQVAEGQPLPHIDDSRLIDIRLDALAELAQLTARDLPPVWRRALPDVILQRMLDIESRRLEHLRSGIRAGRAFPLLPLDRLPLDEATCAVDEFQVCLPGFSELVVYDAWALLRALMEALLIEADEKVVQDPGRVCVDAYARSWDNLQYATRFTRDGAAPTFSSKQQMVWWPVVALSIQRRIRIAHSGGFITSCSKEPPLKLRRRTIIHCERDDEWYALAKYSGDALYHYVVLPSIHLNCNWGCKEPAPVTVQAALSTGTSSCTTFEMAGQS